MYDLSAGTIDDMGGSDSVRSIDGVISYRVTVFRDGFGRLRPCNVGACGSSELQQVLLDAQRRNVRNFVIVSHNFEMLKPGSSDRDLFVVARFKKLCRFLADRPDLFEVGSYPVGEPIDTAPTREPRPQASLMPTAWRFVEQTARRLV